MNLDDLKNEIENLLNQAFLGRLTFQESYDFDERYSESLAIEAELKPKELNKFINSMNLFKKDLAMTSFFEEVKQKKLKMLTYHSDVFSTYSADEALNKQLLQQRDIIPNIVSEYAYRDILNEVELNNMIKLIFVVSFDEDEDEENNTYQLDMEVVTEDFRKVIRGGEAVDLNSASNNVTTLAKWLTSNLVNI
jgi:uncharacterized UPF0160 family protein